MNITIYLNDYFNKLIEKAKKEKDTTLLKAIRTIIQNSPISHFKDSLQDTRQLATEITNIIKLIESEI